jgi:GT2 family glycosyltransferase
LEELVKAADKDTKVAIFQSSIYSFDGTIQNIGFMLDKYGDILPILNPEECHSLFYANGASILLRSSVIKRIGLFDKELFILQDDVDLSWRTRLCGYEIGLVPTSICFHKSNASMPPLPFLAYYEFRNRIRVLIKNYSSSNIVKRAALAIAIIEFDSLVLSIKSGSAYFALSYIRAIWWNLIKLSDTLKQRTLVQKMRRIADSEIEKYMLNYPIMILRAHVRLHHT